MAAITPPAHAPGAISPPWRRARKTLAWVNQGLAAASAARRRFRRPALAAGGLACFDLAAWHTFGTGAGLLVLGACLWALELLTGDEPDGGEQRGGWQ